MIQLLSTGAGGLWVGPWESVAGRRDDFDVIAMMAPELRFKHDGADDRIIHFPASDQPPYDELFRVAHLAAAFAESAVNLGKRVGVCCREGLNRSVLACALVLHWRERLSGEDVVKLLREKVGPRALNEILADYVRGLR